MSGLSDAQLADLEAKARASEDIDEAWCTVEDIEQWAEATDAEFIAAADPSTVLALIEMLREKRSALSRTAAPEPEWEYAGLTDYGRPVVTGTLEDVANVQADYLQKLRVRRRRKAGPWEPLPVGGDDA